MEKRNPAFRPRRRACGPQDRSEGVQPFVSKLTPLPYLVAMIPLFAKEVGECHAVGRTQGEVVFQHGGDGFDFGRLLTSPRPSLARRGIIAPLDCILCLFTHARTE